MNKTPMIRTYVQLPQQTYYQLKTIAASENLPFTAVTRRAIDSGLKQEKRVAGSVSFLFELEKLGKKLKVRGPKDWSANLDKYTWDE
jgi:hypothetical protein